MVAEFNCQVVRTVDDSPAVLAAADLFAIDDNVLLRTNHGERNDALAQVRSGHDLVMKKQSYFNRRVQS